MSTPERRPRRRLRVAERTLRAELQASHEQALTVQGTATWTFRSVASLLLEVGQWYRASEQFMVVTTFNGAFAEARARRIDYVEGAVLDADGQVREAAWGAVDEQVVLGPTAQAYLGIPIALELREQTRKRFGTASTLHSRGRDGWRLLRYGLPST